MGYRRHCNHTYYKYLSALYYLYQCYYTLVANEVGVERGHTARTLDSQEHCAIHANKEILVAQFQWKVWGRSINDFSTSYQ